MEAVTLILTRTPVREFIWQGDGNRALDGLSDEERKRLYLPRGAQITDKPTVKRYSGRWGRLGMVCGPVISAASFAVPSLANVPVLGSILGPAQLAGGVAGNLALNALSGGGGAGAKQYVWLGGRVLELTTDGTPIRLYKEYTSMERYRGSYGGLGKEGYVMLHSKPDPYGLRVERGNSVVKHLHNNTHNGDCIRVLGGNKGPEQGILIHEAPHVGWLIGCISPRPVDDFGVYPNQAGNPSDRAIREIMDQMAHRAGGHGHLFVLP